MVDISNKDIYDLLQTVLKKTDSIENQIKTHREELKQDISIIHSEIKNEIEFLRQTNIKLEEENKNLKNRLLVTERKLKKYNLVIYGLKEEENRIEEINSLMNLVTEKLHIDCRYTDIRDFYRIGKKIVERSRPAIIEFINYQLKAEILTNARQLKGTGIIISNDYIPEDYHMRKVLHANLKLAREKKFEAYIKNNELVVNGEIYTYEELKEQQFTQEEEEENLIEEVINIETNCNISSPKQAAPGSSKQEAVVTRKRKEQPTDAESILKRSNRLKNK